MINDLQEARLDLGQHPNPIQLMARYFNINGKPLSQLDLDTHKIYVHTDGAISVDGGISQKKSFPGGKLPIRFHKVNGYFMVLATETTDGFPDYVDYLRFSPKKITKLPQMVKNHVQLTWLPDLGLMKLFLIDLGGELFLYSINGVGDPRVQQVEKIINKYIKLGRDGIIPCAAELHKAGYGGNAKL